MIKKIAIIFIFFLLIVGVLFSTSSFKQQIVVKQHNTTKEAILMQKDKYKDRFCNMSIQDINYSAQAVLVNNDTLFFDDIGCLVLWLEDQKQKEKIVLWVYAKDILGYINAKEAWYSFDEFSPMRYGFGAYKKKQDKFIDFNTMRQKMLKQETMANPKIRKHILGNN
jgi:hypothetical protein